jgi:hypothetical protein
MTTLASKFAKGYPLPTVNAPTAGVVVANDFFVDLTAAQIVAGDIIDLGILPAGHTVSDVILAPDDLDTNVSPTLTLDVGIMSGTPGDTTSVRTCSAVIFSASTAAQSGTPARPSLKSAFNILPTDADRSIGVKIVTGAATAAAGRIRLRVFSHASDPAVAF